MDRRGGAATALGNLGVGSTATQIVELDDKWFMGSDLPWSTVQMNGELAFSVYYSTVADPVFGAAGPSINDINQGWLGDCYLLSSLAECAAQDPSLISSMITDNGDDTYGVSRLSEDWILYSSEEFEWISLGDGVTSGSSLMPQKKNPDSLELMRGKSGRVFGDFASLFVTMKGLPMTYNRDMQEDKEPLFDAFHQTSGSLAMAKVVADSVVLNPAKPAAAAEDSWVVATDLAEELARSGVAFHRAHQLVGSLVLESVKSGKKPSQWTGESLAAFAPEFKPEMAKLLNPIEGMQSRSLPGGTAPEAVSRALAEAKTRLESFTQRIR